MVSVIGIKLANGEFYSILEENATVTKRLVLTTVHDNQQSVHINLYKSDTATMQKALHIGSLPIEHLKPAPKGEPSIELVVTSDGFGKISVDVVDMDSTSETHHLQVSLHAPEDSSPGMDAVIPNLAPPVGLYVSETKKKFPWLIVLASSISVLLILFLLWFFLLRGEGSRKTPPDIFRTVESPQPEQTPLHGQFGAGSSESGQLGVGATNALGTAGAADAGGTTGAFGTSGALGATGVGGTTGGAGATGVGGTTGGAGATGTSGALGTTGVGGTTGALGATGVGGGAGTSVGLGTTGVGGGAGTSGALGATGVGGGAGTSGALGTTGVGGTTGGAGATGTNGALGATGVGGTTGGAGATGVGGGAGTNGGLGATGVGGGAGTSGGLGATGVGGTTGGAGTSGALGASGVSVADPRALGRSVTEPEPFMPIEEVTEEPKQAAVVPLIEAPVQAPEPPLAEVIRTRPAPPVASYKVPTTIPPSGVLYRIRWGDTLWDISEAFYRNPWLYPRIVRFNRIRNPDLIVSGTTIRIPPR